VNKQFLLVVTYGRSGSTLLNGILNSIDGYKIVGENNDAYTHLMKFYNCMIQGLNSNKTCEKNFNIFGAKNPWWNDFNPESLCGYVRIIMIYLIDPQDKYRVVGFKEIRYPRPRDELYSYLDWLYSITNCKFVFLTRNLTDVCNSEWHRNNPGCVENLRNFEYNIHCYIDEHPEQSWYHLTFKEMINNRLKWFFEFLGEHYDKKTVDAVLSVKHGYHTVYENEEKLVKYLKERKKND